MCDSRARAIGVNRPAPGMKMYGQSRLTDIGKLFSQTFVMPKAMIEEISLPSYSPHFGGDSFIIPNQLRKRVAAIDTNQRVQMIRHEQQKIQVPSSALVIDARCVEQHVCAAFAAKLI